MNSINWDITYLDIQRMPLTLFYYYHVIHLTQDHQRMILTFTTIMHELCTVERVFGEIDLRWGILWKSLTCSLANATIFVEGAMRLHKFLVDC